MLKTMLVARAMPSLQDGEHDRNDNTMIFDDPERSRLMRLESEQVKSVPNARAQEAGHILQRVADARNRRGTVQ